MIYKRHLAIPAGLAMALLCATPVMAQTTTVQCNDTSVLPNPVYMAGSSAFEPTLKQLAAQIRAKQNISIIYSLVSSCTGVADIADPTQTLTGTADYYTFPSVDAGASGTAAISTCTLATGTSALIGVSDVFYDSCPVSGPMPAAMGEWQGPVQSMLIIVPKANVTTTALSYLQAAAIFGCGAKGLQTPFTVDTSIEVRTQTSGTQTMIGAAIGVPPASFKGVQNSSGGNLVTALLALRDPQSAIGILAADAYDPKRSTLNSVAFQGVGQTKAYYADSDATTLDKKNVRDGHYVIQGPVHFFTGLTNGQPTATAKKVLDWLTGTVPIDASDTTNTGYISTVALAGDVPQCAMKVKINKDGGLFSPSTPTTSCNCFFDKTVTKSSTPPAGCVACTSDSQCTGGKHCQTGYCE